MPILGECKHFIIRVVSYGFVCSSSESMLFLSIFLELVALSRTKLVPRISAFLSCFLEWVYMYPFFLRARKEDKLGVSTWMAMRLQVFQQCINASLTLHNFTEKSYISSVFKNCNNALPYLAHKLSWYFLLEVSTSQRQRNANVICYLIIICKHSFSFQISIHLGFCFL